MFQRLSGLALALAIALGIAGPANAAVIAIEQITFFPGNEAVLANAGFTVVNNPDLNSPITADVLYLGRGSILAGAAGTNVRNFLASGGTVITEYIATRYWFNGALASFGGTLVNDRFVPSGHLDGRNLITVTDPSSPLTAGLPGTFVSGEPIGVFQVYSELDSLIETPLELLGSALGDIPVVGVAAVGAGTAIMFFSDFGDFAPNHVAAEERLLVNAASYRRDQAPVPAPEPASLLLLGSGLVGIALMRRRRSAA